MSGRATSGRVDVPQTEEWICHKRSSGTNQRVEISDTEKYMKTQMKQETIKSIVYIYICVKQWYLGTLHIRSVPISDCFQFIHNC